MSILKAYGALNSLLTLPSVFYRYIRLEKIMRSKFVCIMAIALKITFKYFVQLFLYPLPFFLTCSSNISQCVKNDWFQYNVENQTVSQSLFENLHFHILLYLPS